MWLLSWRALPQDKSAFENETERGRGRGEREKSKNYKEGEREMRKGEEAQEAPANSPPQLPKCSVCI